jgi:leucyl/phenylalanyl-tRNA---protein transferase
VTEPLDLDLLLRAYTVGVFPMADARDAKTVYWVEPKTRAVLPLDGFHLSKSLRKTLLSDKFETTANKAFGSIVALCAESAEDRPSTWINDQIESAVATLHRAGNAHSIETWLDGELVGGLYGISLGRAFFGESMVSRATDASKIALAHLVARLRVGGFSLLDCQFMTPHLASLGAIEVSRKDYIVSLDSALSSLDDDARDGDFLAFGRAGSPSSPPDITTVSGPMSGWAIAQALTQTSYTGCSTTLSEGVSL